MNPGIEELYFENEYSSRSIIPYSAYVRALESVFDLSIVDSFCDAGCSSGRLLTVLKQKYPQINRKGIDYFEWAKKNVDVSVRECIELADLSRPLEYDRQYDFVNCTEVGEHLEPTSEPILLENLKRLSNDILILGWSEDKVEDGHQHLNPRPKEYIRKKMVELGFDIWEEATKKLKERLHIEVGHGAYEWWAKPITVYRRRRFFGANSRLFIQGCSDDNREIKSYHGKSLQASLLELRDLINLSVLQNYPLSILRIGDGDFYFFNAIPSGSAKPGFRALTINYQDKKNLPECRRGVFRVDIVTTDIKSNLEGGLRLLLILEALYKVMPNIQNTNFWKNWHTVRWVNRAFLLLNKLFQVYLVRCFFYPILTYLRKRLRVDRTYFPILKNYEFSNELIYALVSSKLIFRMYPNEILLVGQMEKISAIKELVKHKSYREYLGISEFSGYVGVKKVGAADNELAILDDLRNECRLKNPKIILLGIGSAKLFVIPKIKEITNAIVIDVGAGIDALAGVVSQDRPYFAGWKNYKSKNIDYKCMNVMDEANPNRDSIKYKKVILE
jgi:SAM-dependent methyltransferase